MTRGCTWELARRALIGASITWACGSGSGGVPSGGGARPSQAEVESFVTDYCGLLAQCCTDLGYQPIAEGCRQHLLGDGTIPPPSSLKLAPPAASYDPVAGAACLAQLREPRDAGSTCLPMSADPSDPCAHLFQGHFGNVPPGGMCAADSDCAPAEGGTSVCTFLSHGGSHKQCLWLIPGSAGDGSCIGSTDLNGTSVFGGDATNPRGNICRARDGLYCIPSRGCTLFSKAGEPCPEGDECAASYYCESNGLCASGSPVGQPCGASCATDAYCDEPSRLCVTKLPPGSSCSADYACSNGLCSGGRCTPLTELQRLVLSVACNLTAPAAK